MIGFLIKSLKSISAIWLSLSRALSWIPLFKLCDQKSRTVSPILLSSILVGILALFGEETENDDDDSDLGSGGLMQPIWIYL